MGLLAESIDKKFGEAEQLFLAGKNPFVLADGALNILRYEIIGLDCEKGGDGCYRYLLSRHSLDSSSVIISKNIIDNPKDMDISNYMVRIPRPEGDHRAFEDLPKEAFVGEMMHIDIGNDIVAELANDPPLFLSDIAINALAEQLGSLRVAERMSLTSE